MLAAAVVEHEDRRFYQHGGLDVPGLARATWASLSGVALEGGSTLTQQLVKNTLLADQHGARTLSRKVQEAWLAVQVDRRFSKAQILTAYLNVAYWGAVGDQQVVGAEQAARAYFHIPASRLNLAQSAYLATLLPAPARAAHPAEVRPLIRTLLAQMLRDGRATAAQAAAASPRGGPAGGPALSSSNGCIRFTDSWLKSRAYAPSRLKRKRLTLLTCFINHPSGSPQA